MQEQKPDKPQRTQRKAKLIIIRKLGILFFLNLSGTGFMAFL
jgi:hypothetical protein